MTAADGRGSAVVAVTGDGADARVETRFAGRTFASTGGTFTPRVPKGEGYAACEDGRANVHSQVTCSLPVNRAAYVPGLGVAPSGKEWLVVSGAMATRDRDPLRIYRDKRPSTATYLPTDTPPRVSITVEGTTTKPQRAGRDTVTGDGVLLADRAWLVPADKPSTVRLRYRLTTAFDPARSDWDGAPKTHEVDVSTTTTFPAA